MRSADQEMQVKAVYKLQLRHMKDVIVFPTKGQIPLASKLQGGDYDGDKVSIVKTRKPNC